MELVNNQVLRLSKGNHTFITEMSSGSSKLQISDPSDSDSSYVDISDTSKSASDTYNLELYGDANVKVVITGDAEVFYPNRI